MAWRDDCTKHKPKTGGMSTKLGESQEIKPKFDQTFADQPPHPPGCAPRGHGTGIPAILDDLMEATPVSSPKKTLNHNEIFVKFFTNFHQLQPASHQLSGQQRSTVFHKVRDDDRYDRAGPLEEKRGNFAVYDATGNFTRDDATGNFAVYDATENFAGYDATGNFAGYDATGNFAGYDATGYLPEAPAPPRGEKRGDGDPAPPRGEKRGDGDRYAPAARAVGGDGGHYAAVPNVDPGGQQRPEVNGTFKDPGCSRVRIPDRRRHFLIHTSQWRVNCFRPASESRRRSHRSNRDCVKKPNNDKTSVMGPVFPNENRNPNKWETQKK